MIRLRRGLLATAVCLVALGVVAGSALADKKPSGPPGSSAANPIVLTGQTTTVVTNTENFSDAPAPAPGGGPSPFSSFGGGNCSEAYSFGKWDASTVEAFIDINCTPGVHNLAGTAQLWRGGITAPAQFLASDTEIFGANGGIWSMFAGCPANQTWAYHTNISYTLISQAGYGHQFYGVSPYVYIRC